MKMSSKKTFNLTHFIKILSSKKSHQCQCHKLEDFRSFMSFIDFSNKKKEFSGRQLVGYKMEQMYAVVADVRKYNQFVPWCTKSIILSQKPGQLKAKLIVGFPPLNESYTSHVTLIKPHMVKAECKEGRLFHHMFTLWRFSPGLKREPNSCVVDFHITFEFRSTFHSQFSHKFFDLVVKQMQNAFLTEVRQRYGPASLETRAMPVPDLDRKL